MAQLTFGVDSGGRGLELEESEGLFVQLFPLEIDEEFLDESTGRQSKRVFRQEAAHVRVETEVVEHVRVFLLEPEVTRNN